MIIGGTATTVAFSAFSGSVPALALAALALPAAGVVVMGWAACWARPGRPRVIKRTAPISVRREVVWGIGQLLVNEKAAASKEGRLLETGAV
ncbi:hypothetical protein GCM10010840_03690 [Deinococcus aerolatus]|uniref:Uncharacterized protein n=1 Tax=Deinococcus aerolatus TaxID=522487 RepID=A0ABQ2G067_9DEIO|nr:hypothetical protein GCM10010840_03690 [Deinococcus aerolatus]